MKLLSVFLLAVFLASAGAHPWFLACDNRTWDGTAKIMGADPTPNMDDRALNTVGGTDCGGTLEANWKYDVSITVPASHEYVLEADGAGAVFDDGTSGCTNRIASPSGAEAIFSSTAKVTFTTTGETTLRLMAASGKGVSVGTAPDCTFTVAEFTNDPSKRVYFTNFGASASCAAEDAFVIESYLSGTCIDEGDTSTMLVCGPDNNVRKYDYTSSDCSGSGTMAQIDKTACLGDGGKVTYSCDEPNYPGQWWVNSIGDADSCNGKARSAIKSGFCRDDDGSKSVFECNADGTYSNKEDCNANCSTCGKSEAVPVVSCQTIPNGGEQLYDLQCTSGNQTVGALLAMTRPEPTTGGSDSSDGDEGGECPAGGMVSTDENSYCITCDNSGAVAECLDEIGNAFKDIPTLEETVLAGKSCEYIDAIADHAARCFGSYACCDAWGDAVQYWKTIGAGFEACTFPSACITGCTSDDDGSVTGPCFPTCSADAQMCVNDVLSAIGDPASTDALCAAVTTAGPAVADCFAAGGCCGDMTASVALWESQQAFVGCGSTSPFPQECKEAANKVLMSVNLPIATAAEFTTAKRTQFRQGLATAAGVTLEKVVIKKVTEVDVRRRHLLAASLKVDTAITVADEVSVRPPPCVFSLAYARA
mmetsp:Transcript_26187/g.62022  ORF Transcript_26187/g.62022 Transcript_26187/m.62022 type:complete len:648 (+) Transcript_26187:83-2026(+)